MSYIKLIYIALIVLPLHLCAFDNEIIITGTVADGVAIDKLMLSKNKDDVYLSSNSKSGARVLVRALEETHKERSILNNGTLESLPLIYELFQNPAFLGTSPIEDSDVVLGIDISAH